MRQTRKDASKQGHTTAHGYRKAQWTRLTLLGRHLRRDCTAWIALVTQTPAVRFLHPDLDALKRGRQSLSSPTLKHCPLAPSDPVVYALLMMSYPMKETERPMVTTRRATFGHEVELLR